MFATFFVLTPRSMFGPCQPSLASFFPDADAAILDHATPLTARRGLLLVCLTSRRQYNMSVVRLAVCNLLAGVCDVLPLLSSDLEFDKSGYSILTSADYSSSTIGQCSQPGCSTFFKVLITGRRYLGSDSLYTFLSSEAGIMAWTIYVETSDEPQLGVTTNGTPLVLTLSRPGLELKICTWQDDNKSKDGAIAKAGRLTTRIVELKPPRQIKRSPNQIHLRLLGEKTGTMLLKDGHRQIYIADIETGVMEEFELSDGFDGLNRSKVVLLKMDWLALFVSRLGKW
ncbi:hypothetical protein VPH35_113199 [Triticum aestivum]